MTSDGVRSPKLSRFTEADSAVDVSYFTQPPPYGVKTLPNPHAQINNQPDGQPPSKPLPSLPEPKAQACVAELKPATMPAKDPEIEGADRRKLIVSVPKLAAYIDHSLLHPTMTDAEILSGLQLALRHRVAAVCVKPYSVTLARRTLLGSGVKVCVVAGFPHGSSTVASKIFEAREAIAAGAEEVDVVVNVGKVLSGEWGYVKDEIARVNEAVTGSVVGSDVDWHAQHPERRKMAILKVIFENDYLGDDEIVRLCKICTEVGVAFVKTSTGFGFVKGKDGRYGYQGATLRQLRLMRKNCGQKVQIKAAGGVRTLEEMLDVIAVGVTRVGATATEVILDEARQWGIGDKDVEVEVADDYTNGDTQRPKRWSAAA
jgi:deoxyribose-phosphate aldolase